MINKKSSKITYPKDNTIRVRFQKVNGAVICEACQRFLGAPSYSNGIVNETKVRARVCPACGGRGKLVGFNYTGRCRVSVHDPLLGNFTGASQCKAPDVFNREIGYKIALSKALRRRKEAEDLVAEGTARVRKLVERPIATTYCAVCDQRVPSTTVSDCIARGVEPMHAKCEEASQIAAAAEAAAATPDPNPNPYKPIESDGVAKILDKLRDLREEMDKLGLPQSYPVYPIYPGTTPSPITYPWTITCDTHGPAQLEDMLSSIIGHPVKLLTW